MVVLTIISVMDAIVWLRAGAFLMLLAVALGAFGAHALKSSLSAEMQAVYETGVRYHAYHALGMLAAAWAAQQLQSRHAHAAAACFLGGILLFSGSLYALALTGIRKLGAITPFGGLLFLAGWALLAFGSYGRISR